MNNSIDFLSEDNLSSAFHVVKLTQPVKTDLNKRSFPKQKNFQNFNIDARGFRKTKNENPLTLEIGVTS